MHMCARVHVHVHVCSEYEYVDSRAWVGVLLIVLHFLLQRQSLYFTL